VWFIDFCHRRSAECIQIAEGCADSDMARRRAWLELAKQWGRLPEETVLARRAGGATEKM